jgi:hypothetical protein
MLLKESIFWHEERRFCGVLPNSPRRDAVTRRPHHEAAPFFIDLLSKHFCYFDWLGRSPEHLHPR